MVKNKKKKEKKQLQNKNKLIIVVVLLLTFTFTLYFTYNIKAKNLIAKEIAFDPSTTGLTATNAQDAVEQLYSLGKTGTLTSTNSYLVQFECNGCTENTEPSSQNVASGGKATRPTNPTKENNTFGGWYSDSGLTTAYDFNTAVTSNKTLYAKWTANTYTVTFNSNGGSSVTTQTISHGGKATRPTDPTKENNTFGGWYSDSGLTTAYDFNTAVTSNKTLYAKWTANSSGGGETTEFTVTFNSNGGSSVATQTVAKGSAATRPSDPTKTNNTFAGWYSDAGLTTVYNFSLPVNSNIVLYAKWTATSSTITESNGKTTYTKNDVSITIPTTSANGKNVSDFGFDGITASEKSRIINIVPNATDAYGFIVTTKDTSGNDVDLSDTDVSYSIPLPSGFSASDNLKLYKINGSNKEEIPFTISNGKLVFTTKGTGEFALVKISDTKKAEKVDNGDGTESIKKDDIEIKGNKTDIEGKNIDDVSIKTLTDEEKENAKNIISGATDVSGYKIELKDSNGNKVDVSDIELEYRMPLPSGFDPTDNLKLYRIDGNNKEEIPFTIENGYIVFKTKNSGEFVIAKFPGVPSQILKTGQKVVKYGTIISSLLGLIIIGILINRNKNKKKK